MNVSKLKKTLNKTRFRMRQKTINAMLFANVKTKLYHDKRHKFLLLKKNKIYLKFYKNYKFSKNSNKKFFNQRCKLFLIKRQIDCFVYKFELSLKWRVYFVILMIQLKSTIKNNFYDKIRSNYFEFVKIKKYIEFEKLYKIEKMINKRERKYEKIAMIQYLICWLRYESKHDK